VRAGSLRLAGIGESLAWHIASAQALASLLYALRLHRLTYVAVRLEAGLSRGGGRGLTVCSACVSCAVLYEHRLLTSKCEAL